MSVNFDNRWDSPFRTGFAQQYDPGTMFGLIQRSQQGDLAAKNHLTQAGFFGAGGSNLYNIQNGYGQAVDAWARAKNLTVYGGANPFRWNDSYRNDNNAFTNAWNAAFGNDGNGRTTGPAVPEKTMPLQPPATGTLVDIPNAKKPPMTTNGGAGFSWAQGAGGVGHMTYRLPNGQAVEYRIGWGPQGGQDIRRTLQQMGLGQYASAFDYNSMTMPTGTFSGHGGYTAADRFMYGLKSGAQAGLDLNTAAQRALQALKQINGGTLQGTGFNTDAAGNPVAAPAAPGQPGSQPGTPGAQPPPTTPPAPVQPPQAPQVPGAPGSGLTAAQKAMLSDDPNQAYRYAMQQQGYNVDAPGLLGGYLKSRFKPLLEAAMAASEVGDNSNYMDNIGNTINSFGSGLFQQGGDFYGNLRQQGQQALGNAGGYLNALTDQSQAQQYLNQLGMLRYAGSNGLVQQAMADEMGRAGNQYNDYAFQEEGAGRNINTYLEWLRRNRYAGLFG